MTSVTAGAKIGVLTSGGDAPGMNAVIRSIVRTALHYDLKVIGIKRGYEGLISGEIEELKGSSVSNIISAGGTILRTARCPAMTTEEGRQKAAEICKILKLDLLVVIGGDGSFAGALELSRLGVNVTGIPATIDLDMTCTNYTIGFDTAVNTGMEAINKLRDTSSAHERCSVVELMGRGCGQISLWCGLTNGAEEVIIPEKDNINADAVIARILHNRSKGKTHNLVIVAEGVGGSAELAEQIEKVTGISTRATILGHLQRGGSPSAQDRHHASLMGHMAVDLFLKGEKNRAIIYRDGKHTHMDLGEALACERKYDDSLYQILKILSI